MNIEELRAYVYNQRDRYLDRLRRYCEQPSISATGEGMEVAFQLTQQLMQEVGMVTDTFDTPDFPAVLGTKQGLGETILGFYGHYDVQPVDPIDRWDSDPFQLTFSNGRIYARGVADTKGHLVARLCAIEVYEEIVGPLPLTLKIFAEGEEEIGSHHLSKLAHDHQDELRADGYIWESGHNTPQGRPTIYLGMKGNLCVEIIATESRNDIHSMYGTIIPNPLWKLTWVLAAIKGSDNRINVPGWYDAVKPPSKEDLESLRSEPIDPDYLQKLFGIKQFVGGFEGYEVVKQHIFSPTSTINGWWGGYSGKGHKTVLPSQGGVKLDFRLVSDQDPDELFDRLQRYINGLGYGVEVQLASATPPAKTDPKDPLARALIEACEMGYQQAPGVLPLLPGSGPMYELCHRYGMPACGGAGVIRPDSNVHGPNENIHLEDFLNAITATVVLIDRYNKIISES
jgi:acetylornithine deacetylase/succinyl-diaminopimelate desuccinylase-like protein